MDHQKFRHISLHEREIISREVRLREANHKTRPPLLKNLFKTLIKLIVVLFAVVGIGFLAVYASVNLHLTNTSGIVDSQAQGFWDSGKETPPPALTADTDNSGTFFNGENYCRMEKIKTEYPGTFWRILDLALSDNKDLAQKNLNVAMENSNPAASSSDPCDGTFSVSVSKNDFEILANMVDPKDLFLFATSSEWSFFKTAVVKDKDVIKKVEDETGIKGRVLVAELVAEQMRLYYSSRGWFEKVISPLKVLDSMSQFSWGVMGIKEDTAEHIEANLKNKSSLFYPGPEYENMLDFSTKNISQERFKRMTDYSDHYYGYLYGALFNKEIIAQWQQKGIDISNRPEILATIFNIGFAHSNPNNDPQTGGAELDIAGQKYSFGRVAYDFYYSGELLNEFPQ